MSKLNSPERFNEQALVKRIDFLRGAFAVWVLIAHTYGMASESATDIQALDWLSRWINILALSGYIGVVGFFFLSGFCIQWSIIKRTNGDGSKPLPLTPYFKARFYRIAPLFYVGLIAAILINWIVTNYLSHPSYIGMVPQKVSAIFGSAVFLHSIFGTQALYSPSATITNEVIYYIAWPLILVCLGFKIGRSLVGATLIAVAATALFYLVSRMTGPLDWMNVAALWTIPLGSLMWIVGAACRTYYDRIIASKIFISLERWWFPLLVLWIVWATSLAAMGLPLALRIILDPFVYIAIPLLVMAGWKVPISDRTTRWLADLSYPLYLFHAPLLTLVACILFTLGFEHREITGVAAGAIALLFSGTFGVWLERKFLSVKRHATTPSKTSGSEGLLRQENYIP